MSTTVFNPNNHYDGYRLNRMVSDFCEAVGFLEFDIDENDFNGCIIETADGSASIEAKDARPVTGSGKTYGYRQWEWESGDRDANPELVQLMNNLNGIA